MSEWDGLRSPLDDHPTNQPVVRTNNGSLLPTLNTTGYALSNTASTNEPAEGGIFGDHTVVSGAVPGRSIPANHGFEPYLTNWHSDIRAFKSHKTLVIWAYFSGNAMTRKTTDRQYITTMVQ